MKSIRILMNLSQSPRLKTISTIITSTRRSLFSLLALCLLCFHQAIAAAPTNGLIGHWDFDQNTGASAVDSSVNNHDATLSGGSTWDTGKFGSALKLDAIAGFAETPSSTDFSGTSFTASAWVYISDSYGPSYTVIMEHNRLATGWWGLFAHPNGYFHFRVSSATFNSPSPLSLNTWHHVAGVYNRDANTMKMYINGANVATTTNVPVLAQVTDDLRFGANNDGGEVWKGSLDEVRLYNRALTDAEVSALYSSIPDSGDSSTTAGVIGHWLLNEGSGLTATDNTGNGNDGYINSASWSDNTLTFDGDNDYVNLGSLDISGQELTLSARVMSSELTNCGNRDCRILSKADGTGSNDHYWMLSTYQRGSATSLRFRLKVNGSTKTLVSTADGDITNDELFHIAATYDGSHMRLYKNGVEVGSLATSGTIDTNSAIETWIGGNPNGATSRPWKGSIADVRIYDRVLSEAELLQLYANDPTEPTTSTPVTEITSTLDCDRRPSVEWANIDPEATDLIAIYSATDTSLTTRVDWMYLNGTKTAPASIAETSGTVSFFQALPDGNYKAFYFTDNGTTALENPVDIVSGEVIPSGNPTAHLTADKVSWNISGSFGNGPIRLNSFTVVGEPNPFTDLIMPDSANYQFQQVDSHTAIRKQGNVIATIEDEPAVFLEALRQANTNSDLSHYLQVDYNINPTDYTEFLYNTPITSAGNRYILISERLGNNEMAVEALDADGNVFGTRANVIPYTTNINTGVAVDAGQEIRFTIYPLTAIAPRGSQIHGVRLTQTGSGHDTYVRAGDGGDGKVFIMVDPSMMPQPCTCEASTTVIPAGSPTAALTAAQVSWDITGSFGNGPINLNSFSVVGEPRAFTDIIMPDSVGYKFQSLRGNKQFITNQGIVGLNSEDDSNLFNAAMLTANASKDLSYYLSLDQEIYNTDYTEFHYDTPIMSAGNRYILVSERWGNNGLGIEALDGSGNVIAGSAPVIVKTESNSTHIGTGIIITDTLTTTLQQEIYFTIYPLTAIAPRGVDIHGIRLTQTGANGGDGGDGKVFIMVDPQTMPNCDDRGDAPTTNTQYGDVRHTVIEGMFLGALHPDTETSSQASTNADGDDNNGIDDEDGISIPELTQGSTATFTATVTGLGGYLQGWIDWNGDGDFLDVEEQIATNIQDNSNKDADSTVGIISFNIDVPNSATTEQTYARFRWAKALGLDSTLPAKSGEVEDYSLTIREGLSSCSIDDTTVAVYSTAAVANNSSFLSNQTHVYQAKFNSANWEGQLRAYNLETSNQDGNVKTQQWNGADTINRSNRSLFTYDPTEDEDNTKGKTLTWGHLNSQQRTSLIDGGSTVLGTERLAWLQGSDTHEGSTLRARTKILGDIIHSNISFKGNLTNYGYKQLPGLEGTSYISFLTTKRSSQQALFVGANDGMLHALDPADGSELFAYVPNEIFPKIAALSDLKYGCSEEDCLSHEYLVDGVSSLGDAYFDSTWHSVLIGTLGLGGKAIYALDVTSSDSFAAADVLWELSSTQAAHSASVFASHMGYSLPKPSIVRMANGKWVAIVSNGHGSENNQAVLFIIDIETGELIKAINTLAGSEQSPNGLSTATAVDSNADSIVDIIYAGDLLGNLWAFDVSSSNTDNWAVRDTANSAPAAFFNACEDDACNTPQIITAPPQVGKNPAGGLMVYFGTGKYFDISDNYYQTATPAINSFYGLHDNGTVITSRSELAEQSVLQETEVTNDLKSRVTSNNPVDFTTKRGWHMDLVKPPTATAEGERVISQALLREGRLIFTTMIPPRNDCSISGTSWLMELDALTGKRLTEIPFDTNNDKEFTTHDNVDYDDQSTIISGLQKISLGVVFSTPTIINHSTQAEGKYVTGTGGTIGMFRESASRFSGRMSWKQLH